MNEREKMREFITEELKANFERYLYDATDDSGLFGPAQETREIADQKDVRILELEAEVERLREITEYQNGAIKGLSDQRAALSGLLDEVEKAAFNELNMLTLEGQVRVRHDTVRAILSRRTAERKEPTDASD